MARNRGLVFFLFYLGFAVQAFASDQFVVFFSDKQNNIYTLSEPQNFLTQKSIDRRLHHGIPITEEDLPVSNVYVDSLNTIAKVMFTSRWWNAALVSGDSTALNQALEWDFVMGYDYIAPAKETTGRSEKSGTQEAPKAEISQIDNYTQNKMMGVVEMHEEGFRGENMLIAVFDSGFENVDTSPYFSHLIYENKIISQKDFVGRQEDVFRYDTHGTKVLSTMAAFADGEYAGVAYLADYVLCITEDVSSEYRIEEYNWLIAAEYADSLGVDVINSSVGYSYFDDGSMNYTYEDMDGETAVITLAAEKASTKGMLVVTSVGNEGNNGWRYMNAPADASNILSIGAVDADRIRARFSSFGPTFDGRTKPELVAMGQSTLTIKDQVISTSNGTSFSSPLVAGLAACFWQSQPQLTNLEVMDILKQTATNSESPNDSLGYGIPNYVLASGRQITGSDDYLSQKFTVYPNPVTGKKVYLAPVDIFVNRKIQFQLYDLQGKLYLEKMIEVAPHQDLLELDLTNVGAGQYVLQCFDNSMVKEVKLVVL